MTQHREPSWARNRMPSPSALGSEMERARRAARDLIKLTQIAETGYEELYEASLHPPGNSDGIPAGKSGFRVSDPTGDVASSGAHSRLRGKVRLIAGKLRKCVPILEETDKLVSLAFAEYLDPDFREKLERMREMEGTDPKPSHRTTASPVALVCDRCGAVLPIIGVDMKASGDRIAIHHDLCAGCAQGLVDWMKPALEVAHG